MRWHYAAAVAVLVVTAGCTSLAGVGERPAETVTPAPVPTAAAAPPVLPPGISEDGLHSARTLSTAHRDALANRSYTMHERYVATRTRNNETTTTLRRNETTVVSGVRTYRHDLERVRTSADGNRTEYRQSTYGDGEQWYERRATDGSVTYRGGEIRFGRDQYAYETAFYVDRYLVTNETWTARVQRDGRQYVRLVGAGGSPPWASLLSEPETYRVALLVDATGLVYRMDIRYVTASEEIRYSFRYERIDATTVEPPAWLGEAKAQVAAANETDSD
ncbi:hypothetical protein ACFQGE_03725 [Halomicroarcula sp. GCM10025817]|uniref:hypothetical protein n=1 Tax=Haloarcula TaxID=2237 RepID=UPI0023E81398|nr:hypothetical protein [Halomicroarcula sp. SYNS111]